MMQKVLEFPGQLLNAIEFVKAQRSQLELIDATSPSKVIFLGMGGSGIVGDFVRVLLRKSHVPVIVRKDANSPRFGLDRESLIIAVTYSGKTLETISSLRTLISNGKDRNIVVITSSSELCDFCSRENISCFKIPSNGFSRASLGNMLLPVLQVLQHVKLIRQLDEDMAEALSITLDICRNNDPSLPIEHIEARRIASKLLGTIPVIYGQTDSTDVITLRWKQQFNENAKMFCHCDSFPELLHNEIEIWNSSHLNAQPFKNDDSALQQSSTSEHQAINGDYSPFCLILLRDSLFELESNMGERIEKAKELVLNSGAKLIELSSTGTSELARLISLSYLGDFVSVYLSILKDVDPSKIPNIESVKRITGSPMLSGRHRDSSSILPLELRQESDFTNDRKSTN